MTGDQLRAGALLGLHFPGACARAALMCLRRWVEQRVELGGGWGGGRERDEALPR